MMSKNWKKDAWNETFPSQCLFNMYASHELVFTYLRAGKHLEEPQMIEVKY